MGKPINCTEPVTALAPWAKRATRAVAVACESPIHAFCLNSSLIGVKEPGACTVQVLLWQGNTGKEYYSCVQRCEETAWLGSSGLLGGSQVKA